MTPTPAGELLTLWTVRAAFALYVAALALRLSRPGHSRSTFRMLWTAGCVAFAIHVACAFHFFHGWSHADAYRQTARQTKDLTGIASGFGLYLNSAYLLAWAIDAAWVWRHASYERRPRWIAIALHAFFAFMWFNATVVFPTGPIRWTGLAGFTLLAILLVRRWRVGNR